VLLRVRPSCYDNNIRIIIQNNEYRDKKTRKITMHSFLNAHVDDSKMFMEEGYYRINDDISGLKIFICKIKNI